MAGFAGHILQLAELGLVLEVYCLRILSFLFFLFLPGLTSETHLYFELFECRRLDQWLHLNLNTGELRRPWQMPQEVRNILIAFSRDFYNLSNKRFR